MTTLPRVTFHLPLPMFALATLGLLSMLAPAPALAQIFTVIHTFTGGADGAIPFAGVTIGGPGILYGTTYQGGGLPLRLGVVFKLEHRGSGWMLSTLYEFTPGSDGFGPFGPVVVGPNGALYGTTSFGGNGFDGVGTVFELQPPAIPCETPICYWNETVLHTFDQSDGAYPDDVQLVFDRAGNIYGTTSIGGTYDEGTVFELSPSGGGWTENILHSFQDNGTDGYQPPAGVILDQAGNIYGTATYGGTAGGGTVFKLSPSGKTWTESILHNFPDNRFTRGPSEPDGLIMDQTGNLYGTTLTGGFDGTVFELTPSGGGWVFSTLLSFAGLCGTQPVAMDAAGNLYGTCVSGGAFDNGWVFKLTNSGGSWTLTDLHDFTGGSDGALPAGGVTLDGSGNLYGTAQLGGNDSDCSDNPGCGTVWEITP